MKVVVVGEHCTMYLCNFFYQMKEFWMCNSRNVFCIVGTQHWRFCFSPTLKATEVWWWVNVPCFCFLFFTFYTGTDGLVFLFCFCFKGRLKPLSAPSEADFFFFLSLHWSRHILTVSKPAGERTVDTAGYALRDFLRVVRVHRKWGWWWQNLVTQRDLLLRADCTMET